MIRDAKPLAPGSDTGLRRGCVVRCLARDPAFRRRVPGGAVHRAVVHERQSLAEDCKAFSGRAQLVIASHFVACGTMQLQVEGDDVMEVRAGELVLLPHNDVHLFGSELTVRRFPR